MGKNKVRDGEIMDYERYIDQNYEAYTDMLHDKYFSNEEVEEEEKENE